MSLPSERITLRHDEAKTIRRGLLVLLNGIDNFIMNSGRSLDRAFPELGVRYKGRAYDDGSRQLLSSLHVRLAATRDRLTTKLRLNVVELSAVAFALRVVRGRKSRGAAHPKLERRIEVVRKRAKRTTVRRFGQAEYDRASTTWRAFVKWVRFNFSLRVPRFTGVYRLFKEQKRFLLAVTTRMVRDRFADQLNDRDVLHYVNLAIAEVRRDVTPALRLVHSVKTAPALLTSCSGSYASVARSSRSTAML